MALAFLFKKIRSNSFRMTKEHPQSAVVTIADNGLSIRSRKIIYSVLKLVQLKPLALLQENTAAAIHYVFQNSPEKD